MNIPITHQTLMPYCMVISAARFIEFTTQVFDAELLTVHKKDADSEAVIHAEMRIGDSTLFFADSSPDGACDENCRKAPMDGPRPIQLYIYVENAGETLRKALAAGAQTVMELMEQDNGYQAGIIDPFGNLWWIRSVE